MCPRFSVSSFWSLNIKYTLFLSFRKCYVFSNCITFLTAPLIAVLLVIKAGAKVFIQRRITVKSTTDLETLVQLDLPATSGGSWCQFIALGLLACHHLPTCVIGQ